MSFVIPTERSEWRDLEQLTKLMTKHFYVYILRNNSGNFYIGITSNLVKRLHEHQNKLVDGFTSKYNINKLVYFEVFNDPENAILREKQLKNWSRKKKINLIIKDNPTFKEISLPELI